MAMRKANFQSVNEYFSMQPAGTQVALERVRGAIGRAVRDAEECISYQIPAFKVDGQILLYFAGWKEHYSVYPASDAMMAAFPGELERYRASKGTLRFQLSEPVPVKLIRRVAKFRAEELAARKAGPLRKTAVKSRRGPR
jgi:uncharacterized protein YdhG (YjbR/CyaY superfamily)